MTTQGIRRAIVVGAGGHGKVVVATLQAAGYEVEAVLDDDRSKFGQVVLGVPVTGPVDERLGRGGAGVVLAIGDNQARQAFAGRFPHLTWLSVGHPTAVIHPSVKIGAGTVVFAGAIIQPDTFLGEHAIVNTGATVDHDCRIGDFAHLAPGVHLSGGVFIGEGALLGVGSCVKPGASVGAWATVGAGGAVIQDIPEGTVAVGVPARVRGASSS